MAVDLTPDPVVTDLATRTAAFVRDVVIPLEVGHDGVAPSEDIRAQLQKGARDAGVFAPHVSPEHGGHGLDLCGRAVVFEEAGYSLLGPFALNIAAPDEGNMHMLELIVSRASDKAALPRPARGRRRPLLLRDDRACARCGLGPRRAEHAAVRSAEVGQPHGIGVDGMQRGPEADVRRPDEGDHAGQRVVDVRRCPCTCVRARHHCHPTGHPATASLYGDWSDRGVVNAWLGALR